MRNVIYNYRLVVVRPTDKCVAHFVALFLALVVYSHHSTAHSALIPSRCRRHWWPGIQSVSNPGQRSFLPPRPLDPRSKIQIWLLILLRDVVLRELLCYVILHRLAGIADLCLCAYTYMGSRVCL